MYHFNYVYYHLFTVMCNSFIEMYSVVSEIWKFKDRQFLGQVASAENHLFIVLAMVSWVINGTVA